MKNEIEIKLIETYNNFQQHYEVEERCEDNKRDAYEILKELNCMIFNGIRYYKNLENKWVSFTDIASLKNPISNIKSDWTMKKLTSVIGWCDVIIPNLSINLNYDERIIMFKNGYINLKIDIVEDYPSLNEWEDKEVINLLPITYIEFNYLEALDLRFGSPTLTTYALMVKFLMWCAKGDSQEYSIIRQFLGIVATNTRCEYFLNFYGVSGSGKTTLLDLAKNLVGHRYCVDKPLDKLNDRFQLIPLINKRLLYNADASVAEIDASMLKQLTTTGNIFDIEIKGQNNLISTTLPLNVIVNTNHVISFKDFVGIDRRLIAINFPYKLDYKQLDEFDIEGNKQDTFEALTSDELSLIKKQTKNSYDFTTEAIECIIPDIMKELKKFFDNKKIIKHSKYTLASLEKIEIQNNNVVAFIEEIDLINTYKETWLKTVSGKYYYLKCETLHYQYKEKIAEMGQRPMGKNNFLTKTQDYLRLKGLICELNKVIWIDEKTCKGYITIQNDGKGE